MTNWFIKWNRCWAPKVNSIFTIMKNEKEYNRSFNHCTKRSQRKTTTAVLSAGSICKRIKTTQRWHQSYSRRAAVSSGIDASAAFVKEVFIPKLDIATFLIQKKLEISKLMNRQFNDSLHLLKDHYGLSFSNSKTGNYSFNWLVDLENAQAAVKSIADIELQIIRDGSGNVAIQAKQYYSTGRCLYYIPVMPLYRFLKDRKFRSSRSAVLVLLSACCYLFKYAGVPMYTDDCNYIAYEYDILLNWYEEDEETEYRQSSLKELDDIMVIGAFMEQKFYNENNLKYLEERIRNLKPQDQFDHYCLSIGKKALDLYINHRDKSVFRNAAIIDFDTCYLYDVTQMGQYISFIGSSSGVVSDMLMDMINNELAEHIKIQEPEITTLFNGEPVSADGFEFEDLVFGLMDDVCTVLNNY